MGRTPHAPLQPEELKRRLSALHSKYRAGAPARIAEIETLWLKVRADAADPARDELILAAHTIVGSAPTLGCEALGAAARTLEAALRAAFEGGKTVSENEATEINGLIASLRESLA
jgi:HPt (histidine-containing phosphotransfer) domain-containing protein